ncbi:hypothetical protein SIN8267_02706 [Sinobacterium norvegicum]|uniref:HTH luxR-type domain-containing protein n=2 Tax=Sinobacterium norvegicum TaxID=1641715 RepID=A0ABN8ELL0_9GAMM|nr:hypothetical protein SIN8267_02706 [Sinobacterium norvegicum]
MQLFDREESASQGLIASIYSGITHEARWQQFLEILRQQLGASFATLILSPPSEFDTGVVLNALVIEEQDFTAYNEKYYALDPFTNLPPATVLTVEEWVNKSEFKASEYYRDYMMPMGVEQIMGFDLSLGDGVDVRLRVTRNTGDNLFNEHDKQLLSTTVQPLQQAVEIFMELQSAQLERELYLAAMGEMAMGVIVLDEKARVIRKNEAADRLVSADNGLLLRGDKVVIDDREENKQLVGYIEEILALRQCGEAVAPRVCKTEFAPGVLKLAILLRAIPVNQSPKSNQPCIALFISDPQHRREAPTSALTALFGFTPAESALAMRLANGLTLDEASAELGVSRNTAKSHLSAVFSKTGVTRQTKLVQLILKSVGPIT